MSSNFIIEFLYCYHDAFHHANTSTTENYDFLTASMETTNNLIFDSIRQIRDYKYIIYTYIYIYIYIYHVYYILYIFIYMYIYICIIFRYIIYILNVILRMTYPIDTNIWKTNALLTKLLLLH